MNGTRVLALRHEDTGEVVVRRIEIRMIRRKKVAADLKGFYKQRTGYGVIADGPFDGGEIVQGSREFQWSRRASLAPIPDDLLEQWSCRFVLPAGPLQAGKCVLCIDGLGVRLSQFAIINYVQFARDSKCVLYAAGSSIDLPQWLEIGSFRRRG